MNGCPHPSSFALPVPPVRRSPPPGIAPLLFLFSFLTAPVPSPHSVPCSYVIPTTTLYPGPLSPPPPPSSLRLSPSLLTERFHRRRFFFSPRDSSPFVLVSHPLFHGRSVRSARCSPLSPPSPPGERINDECFTLSPEVGPFAFARARGLFCHYPLCFLYILCVPRSFSLFPRCYQRASFSTDGFPFPASSYLNGGSPPVPLTIPNLV